LSRIEEQAARAREVVMAMLRLSSGEMDPKGAPVVDLRAVLREVVGLVSGPFRQRGITLDFVEPEVSLDVRVDPVAASRIFAQILNSLRAGLGEGTQLSVHGETSASEVAIVFRPSRPVAVGEDDWMATGMGLWVARRMLDQVGGHLDRPPDNTDWRLTFARLV
jgi:signal transduction histidine kinase